jgi:GH15 family glucan-1,4-alpha-glucosidase
VSTKLENYALIGDGESAALISREGSIDWLCWPRFDSAACLAALLGHADHGRWLIGPAARPEATVTRRYQPDTLVVETEFATLDGRVRLIDFMPIRRDIACLVRIVEGVEGTCAMRMDLRLRFDYGTMMPWTEAIKEGFAATAGPDRIALHAPVAIRLQDQVAEAEFSVSAGQRLAFVLRHHPSSRAAAAPIDAEAALMRTQAFWRDWVGRFDTGRTRWPDAVVRSLITLKAMIYRPTGGLIAAPTTSLPEAPGGTMNWDYRYCWLRDSTFTLGALINAGYHDEARSWRDWLLRAIGGSPGDMRIMYRVDGDRHLDEWLVAGLPGYRHALPVRIGNAASTQLQVDVWGEVLDTLHLADQAGLPRSRQADLISRQLAEHLAGIWDQPGAGSGNPATIPGTTPTRASWRGLGSTVLSASTARMPRKKPESI